MRFGIPVVLISLTMIGASALAAGPFAEHFAHEWHASEVVFVGYSFGADVLPVVLNRLPRDLQPRVAGLVQARPLPGGHHFDGDFDAVARMLRPGP
jgi:type IV secretory pathway VirJ component